MFQFKKGVSPLIATVLLIAFSVALGAVVMNWGRTFVGDRTKEVGEQTEVQLTCSVEIQLEFVDVNGASIVCREADNTTRIVVQNIGSKAASGINVRFMDLESNILTISDTSQVLGSGEARKYVFNTTSLGELSLVSVSPMIAYPGKSQNQICSGNTIEVSAIYPCS